MADDNDLIRRRRVFSKAPIDPEYANPDLRLDRYGFLMHFYAYGDRSSPVGWEVDHVVPVSRGGSNHIDNLQPLHWRTNLAKGAN